MEIAATDGNLRFSVADEESISPVVAALVRNPIRIRAVIPQHPTVQTSTSPQSPRGNTHDQPSADLALMRKRQGRTGADPKAWLSFLAGQELLVVPHGYGLNW